MENLEELKAIIAGKPEDATHIDDINTYWKVVSEFDYYFYSGSQWDDSEPLENGTRSLSDIERIIELMEKVKSGYEAYTRIEAVKQRYNGENKHKTNLLIDAEKLLRGGAQEHCNHLADVIEEALK